MLTGHIFKSNKTRKLELTEQLTDRLSLGNTDCYSVISSVFGYYLSWHNYFVDALQNNQLSVVSLCLESSSLLIVYVVMAKSNTL